MRLSSARFETFVRPKEKRIEVKEQEVIRGRFISYEVLRTEYLCAHRL